LALDQMKNPGLDSIREFRSEDIPRVAGLWLRAFRRSPRPPVEALTDYFQQIFFKNPWADANLPSLVYEEPGRGIVGFLGVIPRWMRFQGRRIRVAVASQLMADERAGAYAAAQLMRRLFAGTQDLAFSDGANHASSRLWRVCGGDAALLYSLNWTRILRPVQYGRSLLRARGSWPYALAADALGPVCSVLDAVITRTEPGSRWLPDCTDCSVESDAPDRAIFECVRELAAGRALQPDADLDSFRWLLQKAAEKKRHGPLRKAVVHGRRGEMVGWFLYYLKPGAVGQVLQFGARPNAVHKVLNCLFSKARSEGAIAVSGELEPRHTKEIAASRCTLACPGYAVLAQSRDPDLLNAIHRGDAFLTRLDGEWWARFSDPEWSLIEAARGTDSVEEAVDPVSPRVQTP
jgi:hypothetical protein